MRNNIIIIVLGCLLVSCSANWHVKRAIKKDPTILEIDTVRVKDTVRFITEYVEKDTVFRLTSDTVILQKDNLVVRHFYHNDSVYLQGECLEDTIWQIREVKVPIERVVVNDPLFPRWLWIVLVIIVGLVILNKYL